MKLPKELIVPPQKTPIRLDRFLTRHFEKALASGGFSRTFWKRHLGDWLRVEGRPPKKGQMLRGGERLCFTEKALHYEEGLTPEPSLKIEVLKIDPEFLVVEKPAGIPVHPLSFEERGTLIQGVGALYPEVLKLGHDPREGGLVHRLDNETSGLVLIARNPKAYEFLREEFRRHRVEKEYWALVVGKMGEMEKGKWEKIDIPIAHHPKNKRKMIIREEGEGKREKGRSAITFYKVEKQFPGYTFLKVRIPTGVRHQIRVHFAHLGFPVLGDLLYGGEKVQFPGFDRLFLHATLLSFRHPQSHQKVVFQSPLPGDLNGILKRIQ